MEEYTIASFKFGLDTRKDVLTSQPGTLAVCENAHINPGGEVEKRKAFVEFANVLIFDNKQTSITSITRVGQVATATSNSHGLANGNYVNITGATQPEYNGEFQISNITTNTFDYTVTGSPATPATGTPVFDDQGTFGLEDTEDGLTVFGSAEPNGVTLYSGLSYPNLRSAMPTGITYQPLAHPEQLLEVSYLRTRHRLKEIVFSENFNGKAFVAAKFADDNTFLYYDGTLIEQSWNGLITAGATNLGSLTSAFQRQLVAIGWAPTEGDESAIDVDEDGNAQVGSYLVKSPPGDYFTPIAEVTSTAGELGIKNIDQDTTNTIGIGTTGTRGTAGFQITGNSGTFTLTSPIGNLDATQSPVDLCGGAVAAGASAAATAAAIAKAVNDFTSWHGHSAVASSDNVFVYAPLSSSPSLILAPVDLTVTVTTGTVGAATVAAPTALAGKITPSPLEVTLNVSRNRPSIVKGEAKVEASGGSGTYKFLWAEAGSVSGITLTQENSIPDNANHTAQFKATQVPPNQTIKGNFKCTITDSANATLELLLTVSLSTSYKSGQ